MTNVLCGVVQKPSCEDLPGGWFSGGGAGEGRQHKEIQVLWANRLDSVRFILIFFSPTSSAPQHPHLTPSFLRNDDEPNAQAQLVVDGVEGLNNTIRVDIYSVDDIQNAKAITPKHRVASTDEVAVQQLLAHPGPFLTTSEVVVDLSATSEESVPATPCSKPADPPASLPMTFLSPRQLSTIQEMSEERGISRSITYHNSEDEENEQSSRDDVDTDAAVLNV